MRISDWSQTCALPIYIDKDYDNFGAQSYTDWFPGINLRYDAGDDLVLRGAVTRAIGRPNYAQLAPTIVVNISDNEVEMGKIGRARVGQECVSPCRSRWSPYP